MMPSMAYENLQERLHEVDLLLEAHEVLVKFKKANAAADIHGRRVSLTDLLGYLQELVQDVGPGRPPQVQAVNKAAIALLSAHLQGYIADLHAECARCLLSGRVRDIDVLIKAQRFSNPNCDSIAKLFGSIGFPKIVDGLHWQKMSNDSVKKRLAALNTLRNGIVHGSSVSVQKTQVTHMLAFVRKFTERMDKILRAELSSILGTEPW